MRNKIRYIRLIGLIFVLIVGSSLTFAQNKSKRKSAKKPLVEVVSIVTDEKGSPLKRRRSRSIYRCKGTFSDEGRE